MQRTLFILCLLAGVLTACNGAKTSSSNGLTPVTPSTPGSLDSSFGSGGIVTHDQGILAGTAYGLAQDADGKIIAVGGGANVNLDKDFAVARYDTDGSLDAGFNSTGTLFIEGTANDEIAYAVGLLSDGRIAVGGSTVKVSDDPEQMVALIQTDGTLDTSFASSGLYTSSTAGTAYHQAFDLAVQSDDGILTAGTDGDTTSTEMATTRLATDGSEDSSFGTSGISKYSFSVQTMQNGAALAVQSDGKIVVVGDDGVDMTVSRIDSGGSLDTSFDSDGLKTIDFAGGADAAYAVVVQSDGKILVGGQATTVSSQKVLALVRLNSDGSLDTDFGTSGLQTINSSLGTDDRIAALAVQSDGKILAAGNVVDSDNEDQSVLVRLDSSGSTDTEFGINGAVSGSDAGVESSFNAVIVQSDGAIVCAGDISSKWTLWRYSQ